ncbi:MAG: alpha/beta hydrolase [Lachnospiraceae bacterium]|nr:alpha/beta hydrolase [Lachnospiraceae bacterium]
MKHMILQVIVIYLCLSFALTIFMILKMYWIGHKANGKKYGKDRIDLLKRQGRWRQMPLYNMEEIAEDKSLGSVRLSIFPNDSDNRTKCAIVLPGGGYAHTIEDGEGYPIAAHLNELGYTAFVLEYRTGLDCSDHAPMKDLARTVQHIFDHQEELNIDPENYALIGFSAGGNLAGIYGTEIYGYKKYGTAKPGALIMGYPWSNINHWMQHPYWNIWEGLLGIWLSERGNFFMFRFHQSHEKRESLCVQNFIDDNYPPVYMFSGDDDILVKSGAHTDVLARALKKKNIPLMYQRFFHVPHGVGLGIGTNAEGWLDEAVTFWENVNQGKESK